jgi:hypothetical protein
VPEVFAALRGIIDADRRTLGRFILLGSAQPTIVKGVSESLAGRVAILDLDPPTAVEVAVWAPVRRGMSVADTDRMPLSKIAFGSWGLVTALFLLGLALGCDSGTVKPDGGSGGGGRTGTAGATGTGYCELDTDCISRYSTNCSCRQTCVAKTDPLPPPPKTVCLFACPAIAFPCSCVNHQCASAQMAASGSN